MNHIICLKRKGKLVLPLKRKRKREKEREGEKGEREDNNQGQIDQRFAINIRAKVFMVASTEATAKTMMTIKLFEEYK